MPFDEQTGDGMESPEDSSSAIESGAFGTANDNGTSYPQDILIEAVRRGPILEELYTGPARPSDLTDQVGASRSTIHRAMDSLEEHGLVKQADGAYQLTNFGEVVARETSKYSSRVQSASTIEPFLNTTGRMADLSIPIEHFETAQITKQGPREPHAVINRISELMAATDHMKLLSTILSPIHVEIGYREIMNGTEIEAVFGPDLIDIMLAKYPDKAKEAVDSGRFTIYVNDSVPFELFLFDVQMGMATHDPTGQAEVIIESEDPGAIDWAEALYEEKRTEGDPLVLNH